jgi:hypothetical protein
LPWQDKDDKSFPMDGERIEAAVQRIEQALARIAAIADRGPPVAEQATPTVPPNVLQLVTRHEALRETVLGELERLDEIIGKLEG